MFGCITTIMDLPLALKTAENVFSALGIKLGKSWEAFVAELAKFSCTNLYITSLEFGKRN